MVFRPACLAILLAAAPAGAQVPDGWELESRGEAEATYRSPDGTRLFIGDWKPDDGKRERYLVNTAGMVTFFPDTETPLGRASAVERANVGDVDLLFAAREARSGKVSLYGMCRREGRYRLLEVVGGRTRAADALSEVAGTACTPQEDAMEDAKEADTQSSAQSGATATAAASAQGVSPPPTATSLKYPPDLSGFDLWHTVRLVPSTGGAMSQRRQTLMVFADNSATSDTQTVLSRGTFTSRVETPGQSSHAKIAAGKLSTKTPQGTRRYSLSAKLRPVGKTVLDGCWTTDSQVSAGGSAGFGSRKLCFGSSGRFGESRRAVVSAAPDVLGTGTSSSASSMKGGYTLDGLVLELRPDSGRPRRLPIGVMDGADGEVLVVGDARYTQTS